MFARELGPAGAGWTSIYRPAGRPWHPGERVRLPALAGTLERIATQGWSELYEGELADRQAEALAEAGSDLRIEDLRDHRSSWTEPIWTDYRGIRVTGHRPNSSGFVALELLNILGQFEPPAQHLGDAGLAERTRWAHLGIEASKLAMADRDAYLADPDDRPAPLAELLDRPTPSGWLPGSTQTGRPIRRPPGRPAAAARSGWAWSMRRAMRSA